MLSTSSSTRNDSWWFRSPYSQGWNMSYIDVSSLYSSVPIKKVPPRREDFPTMTDAEFGKAFVSVKFPHTLPESRGNEKMQ